MSARVFMDEFAADPHGARYSDVIRDSIDGPALAAALRVMNQPAAVTRMIDAVTRYDIPPLAGTVHEIEIDPTFLAACLGRQGVPSRRLKQAVGVACKLVMSQHGFFPRDLKNGRPDLGRMDRFSKRFATARKYRKA